jgi:hypothetical protein
MWLAMGCRDGISKATDDYLPGAFSGAAFGYGLARDLSPHAQGSN